MSSKNLNTQKYIEEFLKIKTKEATIIPLKLNKPQQRLYDLLARQWREGKPQRVIILKARQMGFSTLTEALLFKKTATRRNVSTAIVTHKEEATTNLFNMSKLFYDNLPDVMKPETQSSNAKEIIFDTKERSGLKSKIKCMTAGGEAIGRSDTLQNLHISELAFWKGDKKATMDGLMQAVPSHRNTTIIIESTANGYEYFQDFWEKAVKGENDFEPLFCAWWELDEYRRPASEIEELTEEELKIKKQYNLDDEQLAWRRWCIKNNCGGDVNTFRQEYPANPQEAFLTSGESVFNKEIITEQIEAIKPLISNYKKGEFTYTKKPIPIYEKGEMVEVEYEINDIEFVEKENGFITLHEEPKTKVDDGGNVIALEPYALGGDTAGDGIDYFTAKVRSNIDKRVVATLQKQKMDEDEYALQIYCLGRYYHDALIAIENNYSRAPTRLLEDLHYPNLYTRTKTDDKTRTTTNEYGFNTTSKTRPIIISSLVTLMREMPENERDINTLLEMLTFVKVNGKQQAQDGKHDDLVIASAISNFIADEQGRFSWIEVERKEESKTLLEKFFSMEEEEAEGDYFGW